MREIQISEAIELLAGRGYASPDYLLAGLEDMQAAFGWLPEAAFAAAAAHFNLPRMAVETLVAGCGTAFITRPHGVSLCLCQGPVCANAGSRELLEELQARGLAAEASHCMGACDHAPVARKEGRLIGEVTLDALMENQRPTA